MAAAAQLGVRADPRRRCRRARPGRRGAARGLTRRRRLGAAGAGIAIGAGILAIALSAGATAVVAAAEQRGLSPAGLDAIYRHLVSDMAQTSAVVTVLGVLIAVIGWCLGSPLAARTGRRSARSKHARAAEK
ncbi:MAG: hypothetical protein QM622_02290 [Microbacterium sp.]